MKKILRLVTTSVLTLTLVACGEASSSVSSSISSSVSSSVQPSSSVSSSPVATSTFAAVSTIGISAASDQLRQVVGATKVVSVVASLNPNTNPALPLEWYVNGVKAQQTGRVFEYVPTAVGSFKIQAKVGNIASNELTVELALPALVASKVEWASTSQILITAPGGATVLVSGNELADDSFYDLAKGQYVVNLKTPFVQGQSATLTLTLDGQRPFSQVITYDTRTLSLSQLTLTNNGFAAAATRQTAVGGVFRIVKPFDAGITKVYTLSLAQSALLTATPTEFTVATTVPTGATAVQTTTQLLTTGATLAPTFNVTKDTVVGRYTHNITLGAKSVAVVVEVVAPSAEIALFPQADFNLTFNGVGVTAGADGVFEVNRPFATETATPDLRFDFLARNFEAVQFQNNTYTVSLVGPSLVSESSPLTSIGGGQAAANLTKMQDLQFKNFTFAGTTPDTQLTALYADATSILRSVVQEVDKSTPVGLYTFTISAGISGSQLTREVKVRVVQPAPKLDFVMGQYAVNGAERILEVAKTGDVYEIEKPTNAAVFDLNFYALLSNWQSQVATQAEITADIANAATAKTVFNAASGVSNTALAPQTGYTDVLELGAADLFVDGSSLGSFKFVRVGYSVSGPSQLFANLASTRAAIGLGANKTQLVVHKRGTGPSAATVDTVDSEAVIDGSALQINKDTVPGTYTLTYTVDSLTKVVTLVIKNPSAKLFVLSGTDTGTPALPQLELGVAGGLFNPAAPNASFLKFSTTGAAFNKISVDYSLNTDVFVAPVAGVYKVTKWSNGTTDFYADIDVVDLVAGTYNYAIIKKLPSGRIEEIFDIIEVTGLDSNHKSQFAVDTRFSNNWHGNVLGAELGVYEFEFRIAGLTLAFKVEVVDEPKVTVGGLKVGTLATTLYNQAFRITTTAAPTTATAVAMDISLLNLTGANYYTIQATQTSGVNATFVGTSLGSGFANFAALSSAATTINLASGSINGYLPIGTKTSISLGTLLFATPAVGNEITYKINFFRAGAAGFEEVGNAAGQEIVLRITN
jgi:hypothetical protein